MMRHAWAPAIDGRLLANRIGLCRPCTRLLRQLTTAVSVRAAYAFGDWPPRGTVGPGRPSPTVPTVPDPEPAFLRPYGPAVASWVSASRRSNLERDGVLSYTPIDRVNRCCRWCGEREEYHDGAERRCGELALRAAWGDA